MTKELIERITQAREHTQLYGQVLPALWVYQPFTMNAGELFSAIEALQARVVELGDELERERICHAACGVIALSNTPESAATMRQMKDEYRSASVQDVCNAVDREMALRVERDSLAAELAAALPYGPRPKFGAIGSRDVDVAEAQRAWDKAMAAQPAQVPAGSIRLWDTQWASIVNHDNAYNGWSTNDAVNHAVRMTERYIAANVAQNNLPPLPAAPEVK